MELQMKQAYFVSGICMMLSFYVNGMEPSHVQSVQKLVKNPNDFLQEIKEARKPVDQLFDSIKSNLVKTCVVSEWQTEFDNALKNYHTPDHPLLFLDECEGSEANNKICLLSRKIKPHYRFLFEERVNEALTSFENKPIEHVDFGSGGGFQTAVYLAKFLNKKNTAALNAHLIDITYYDTNPEAQKAIVQNWEHLSPQRKERTIKEALFNKKALTNLSTFISEAFPLAQINITPYSSAKLYYETSQNEPNLIVGADITDHKTYATLCKAFPDTHNIALIKGSDVTKAYGTLIEYKKGQDEPIATEIPSAVYDNNLCRIA